MNIFELIKEGLQTARTARALWLYGFFVGLGSAASGGNKGHKTHLPGAAGVTRLSHHAFTSGFTALAIAFLLLAAAAIFMHFVSEGALIEGVTRLRHGKLQSVGEGWREGLAHWAVLLRITLVYLATSGGSLVVLAAPSLIALKISGPVAGVALAIPAALIGVPWLATLYMWQAFASRVAVLENRRARDAIGKARLFLHGRLIHGLKLILASILGRLIVMLVGGIGVAVVALSGVVVLRTFGMSPTAIPAIALGALLLVPTVFILTAISGTTQSSIWTVGYLTEQKQ